jgi:L-iditol 2-dehydrogenase
MKAVLYDDGKGATPLDAPVPRIGDGELLLAVDACGLCGTDLMKLATRPARAVLGHELAGRVAAVGAGVEGLREGDRVVVAHHVPCLECHYCRRGSWSMCRQFKSTNIDPGGFCEFVRVPALHVRHTTLKIPDGLDALAASQTEPLSCCLRNARRLGVRAGDTVGVVGLGAVGQLFSRLCRHLGAEVLGIDLDERRAASLSGVGRGFTGEDELERAIASTTAGRGLDFLVFTAGTPALVAERLKWLRDGGTLNVFASFHPDPRMTLDLNEVYARELSVISSYSPSLDDLRDSLELIASGAVDVSGIATTVYPLADFGRAVDDVRARRAVKAVIAPAGRLAESGR